MKIHIYFALIAATTTLLSCSSKQENLHKDEENENHGQEGVVTLNEQQREALGLELGTFQMRNLTTVVKINGRLEVPPSASADVTAIIGGNVKEIKVFHGDKVKKGQVLAVLEHPDYITLQEDFAEIANRLEFLEQEYNRQKELFENNVGAGKDYQQVRSEYNTAKAKYGGLKSRLQLLNLSPGKVKEGIITNTIPITSPINGYVNEVKIKVGTYADAKDKLFGITDNSEIHADFKVFEKDVHLLETGQRIDFTVSIRPGDELTATIFAIGKEFEANTRSVHIHARLNENPGNLIPGMYVTGHIHTDNLYTRALPLDAIVTEGEKSFIFILDETVTDNDQDALEGSSGQSEKTFRMVEVITGKQDEGYTEVKLLDSLSAGTKVVMNTAYYLLSEMKKEETEHEH